MRTAVTYNEAFADLSRGAIKLGICLWHTFAICATDLARCFIKHPLALLLILATLGYSFYVTATARTERDSLAKQSYAQEITIDSLEILINK